MKHLPFIVVLLCWTVYGQNYTPHHYQQNDWFLEYGEPTAQYVNPAGIAENDQIEIALGGFRTLDYRAGQEFFAMVHPFDLNHSVGLTIFNNGAPLENSENGASPDYIELAYGLGYAYRLPASITGTHAIAFGTNVSLLHFDLFRINSFYAYGVDFGVSINPFMKSRYGHLQLGFAIQNAIQPKVKDRENQFYQIPMNANMSYFWRGLNRQLELAGSVSIVNLTSESDATVKSEPFPLFSQSATYYLFPMLGLKAKFSKQRYPMIGATLNVKRLNLFRALRFDFDISHDELSLDQAGRGLVFNLKTVAKVGPTREERIGAARYRRLKLEPEEAYREAMRLYLARRFLEASYAFGKVITKYPAFHLVDLATYYKGKSFENLRMHTSAREVYNRGRKDYADSEVLPRYLFQLMNIDYKEGLHKEAAEKYQIISNQYRDSEVKPDADYVMGQIRFLQKDYSSAVELLRPILPGNANYVYARYTLAMCYFAQKNDLEAESALKDVIEVTPGNVSERALQDVAYVKLGHLAFDSEPPRLKEAAKYYASVSPTSSDYDEALLGLSWSYLRNSAFTQAAQVLDDMIKNSSNKYLLNEAHLLRGYCYYNSKEYALALASFDKAIEISESQLITQDEINKKENEFIQTKADFLSVQKNALSLSDQLPNERVITLRDELRPKFDKINEDVEAYIQFQESVSKARRFEKNRQRVIRDAKFTKATVRNIKQSLDEKSGPSANDLKELELE